MNAIPLNPETEAVACRVVWFETPAEALADPIRFIAYAMARATHEEIRVLRRHVADADFLEALDRAPLGISIGAPGLSGTPSWDAFRHRHCRSGD